MNQPAEFTDFSGGFTDYYVQGPMNKAKTYDNLLIVQHGAQGKPFTRPGSALYDMTNFQIPPGDQRIGYLKIFENTLLIGSANQIFAIDGGWGTLQGPTGNDVFPATVTVDSVVLAKTWNKHLFLVNSEMTSPQKAYFDALDTLQVRTAGMPHLASDPVAVGFPPAALHFLYRFIYTYTYQVGTLTFKDFGPATEIALATGNATNHISSIPVLANGITENYDTSNVEVEIYRTTNNGATFYLVGSVTNGTTTFVDSVGDGALIDNQLLYTEGGVVDNDPPPKCKLLHVLNNVGYYAFVEDAGEIRGNRIRQSIAGDIDSAPESFFVDVDEDIVGLSSTKDVPVVLCENSAYRIDGIFDELGRGGMFAQRISETCSCVSAQSVVQTLEGVFWAGKDAFYFSDGYNVIKLNEDWDKTYKTFVQNDAQKRRIQGKYDPVHRRIWWSVQLGNDCDRSVVLELTWGVHQKASFVTCSGQHDNWAPTAIEFLNGNLIRGDRRGYLFLHSDQKYTDPNVDILTTPDNWYNDTIIYNYESCQTNFGTDFLQKFVTWVNVQCKNETNLSLQIVSNSDDGRIEESLKVIRYRGNLVWGDPSIFWGDPTLVWNLVGLIEEQRRFPARSTRCTYKGIKLTNALVDIFNSDQLGNLNVNSTLKTATLTGAGQTWPDDIEGHTISFESEAFLNEYTIKAVTSTAVTFSDVTNKSSTATGTRFIVTGYPKEEVLDLIGYMLAYTVVGQTQMVFQRSESNSLSGT